MLEPFPFLPLGPSKTKPRCPYRSPCRWALLCGRGWALLPGHQHNARAAERQLLELQTRSDLERASDWVRLCSNPSALAASPACAGFIAVCPVRACGRCWAAATWAVYVRYPEPCCPPNNSTLPGSSCAVCEG